MRTPPAEADKPELLIVDSRGLHQAGIARLLEVWADVMGLTLKGAVPDALLNASCVPANCKMIIVSLGGASIEDAQNQALIKSIRKFMPQASLVILSDREQPREICAAFRQGAVGYVPTSIEPAVAFQVLSFIKTGGSFFPPSVLSSHLTQNTDLSSHLTQNTERPTNEADLTARQARVFDLLRQGHSNKLIARQLGLSESTVKMHARKIMRKFGVANRTQLAVAAIHQAPLQHVENGNGSGQGTDQATDNHVPKTVQVHAPRPRL
jgi:two-component system, NarL family, nitrate/nitrite response regulator NarL